MRFTGKGIGWLIAGALICASAFPGSSVAEIMGTIAIGLVFIAIYVMKQVFMPRGIGWFIAGGIVIAFCIEEFMNLMNGVVSNFSIIPGDLSDIMIAFIVACGCLFMFYRRNKESLEDAADGIYSSEESEFPFQEEVFREDTAETEVTVETAETPEEAD